MRLTKKQLKAKLDFISNYKKASNAASGSKFDANANVEVKNIATMSSELHKDINIQINRKIVSDRIGEIFDKWHAEMYNAEIEDHFIYVHDETALQPYCVSLTMYPFLLNGMKGLGGESGAPNNLDSFCGSFINLVFAVAAQFAGAVATVEFLMYFEHFVRKEYGDDWAENADALAHVRQRFQQIVYSINQPAAARGYQAVFWNISVFDETYFRSMFDGFVFPDGTEPTWEGLDSIQRVFMAWFNEERTRAVLTFPVVTAAVLTADKRVKHEEHVKWLSKEMSQGNSFFVYMSDSADSLASCCRLRNEVADNDFSYSLGAGGTATGSINVITMNLPLLAHHAADEEDFIEEVREVSRRIHKYQVAYRTIMDDYKECGMLPVYDAGFISLDKQFLTLGLNGLVEAAELFGITDFRSKEYKVFCRKVMKAINEENKKAAKKWGYKFNTEFVPAENLGVKNAKWCKEAGVDVERDCFNSYFYPSEDTSLNILDRFNLYDKEMTEFLDGGSALHLNLEDLLDEDRWFGLFQCAASVGVQYWTYNTRTTICNSCGYIDKRTRNSCSNCGSFDVDGATRVIGFLKRISSFSEERQREARVRHYVKH